MEPSIRCHLVISSRQGLEVFGGIWSLGGLLSVGQWIFVIMHYF